MHKSLDQLDNWTNCQKQNWIFWSCSYSFCTQPKCGSTWLVGLHGPCGSTWLSLVELDCHHISAYHQVRKINEKMRWEVFHQSWPLIGVKLKLSFLVVKIDAKPMQSILQLLKKKKNLIFNNHDISFKMLNLAVELQVTICIIITVFWGFFFNFPFWRGITLTLYGYLTLMISV